MTNPHPARPTGQQPPPTSTPRHASVPDTGPHTGQPDTAQDIPFLLSEHGRGAACPESTHRGSFGGPTGWDEAYRDPSQHCGGELGRFQPPGPALARTPPPWPLPHTLTPPQPPRFAPLGAQPAQGSGLCRWLVDPTAYLREASALWWATLVVYGPVTGAAVIMATVAVVSLRRIIAMTRLAAWHRRARWVMIVVPPTVDPGGGTRLWERLHAIARPWHSRLRHGQPHVGFEIHAIPGRIVIGMWVPSVIPPGQVEHAIRGAWPGAGVEITYTDIPNPVPEPPPGHQRVAEGTRLVLGRHAALPLRTQHNSDPLRAVLASLHNLNHGHSACVQILARPLTGGLRVHLARRAAIRMATSPTVAPSLLALHPTGIRIARLALDAVFAVVRLLLDVLSPTTLTHTRGGHRDHHGQRRGPRPPFTREIAAATGAKTSAAQSMWAVHTTLVTTTALPATATPTATRNARARCRGDAATLAGGFRVFAAHNQLRRRRLRHPDDLGLRAIGSGQLMSTDELAALAHLPLDERTPGLDRVGAIPVAPPPGIPTGTSTPRPPTPTPDATAASAPRPGHTAPAVTSRVVGPADHSSTGATTGPSRSPRSATTTTGAATAPTATAPTAGGATTRSARTPNPRPGPGVGLANWAGAVVLGDSNAGTHRPIALTVRDRSRHLLALGSTGCGKSSLIASMVLADCDAYRGVVLIDPKTDAARDVADRLDDTARRRLVLIDPDAAGPVPLLNLLDPHDPVAVDNLVAVFASIYRRSWGDRIAEAFRMGCQAVIADYHHRVALETDKDPDAQTVPIPMSIPVPIPTLRDVLNLLTKPATRHRIVAALQDSADHLNDDLNADIATYWAAFNNRSDAGQDRDSAAVLNKLRGLLMRDRFTRQLLTGTGPPLDMAAVLDGGICLARLPEGLLGADTTSLIGSLLVAKVWQATTARARLREHQRLPAALYLDEAHRFLHLHTPIDTMLSQARGYGLGMVLALQNFAQLGTRELREGVSANTLHKLFFRLSPEDATYAERHTYPLLTAHDLSHLDNFVAAARLHPDGIDRPAFTLCTRELPAITRPGGSPV